MDKKNMNTHFNQANLNKIFKTYTIENLSTVPYLPKLNLIRSALPWMALAWA